MKHAPAARALAAGLLLTLGAAGLVTAAPYTPQRDDEVVEQLPLRAGSAAERARQRSVQRMLAQQPKNLELALPAARAALERNRRYGDPRDLGSAQAWLQPWWNEPAPPPQARLLKAVVLQARHDFDPAIAELDTLLATPDLPAALRAQAELTRAGVLQVRGRWDEARAGCQRLAAPPLSLPHGAACLAELDSLQGKAGEAAQQLDAIERQPNAPRAWVALLRAELAERQAAPDAGALFAQALQLSDGDLYARAAYADWLLAAGRPDAAATVVREGQPASLEALPDNLLLRLAIALKRSGTRDAADAAAEMQQRFDAAALRGDTSHGRERARFALDVRGDAREALTQARLNWEQQKEPADALLLLRAAKAAGQPDAAAPVRAFVRAQRMQDQRMSGL